MVVVRGGWHGAAWKSRLAFEFSLVDEMPGKETEGEKKERKQSHLSAPAEKSIKANAYVNICRRHNGHIFHV